MFTRPIKYALKSTRNKVNDATYNLLTIHSRSEKKRFDKANAFSNIFVILK